MGLFKDFKEDFSQAVNEMMPGADAAQTLKNDDSLVVDTLGEDVDVQSELSKLDGLLENVNTGSAVLPKSEPVLTEPVPVPVPVPSPVPERTFTEEKMIMNETRTDIMTEPEIRPSAPVMNPDAVVDETTVITASTILSGDISTKGSFDIQGTINGNVVCNGKLSVTGTINGNSQVSEFFADVAKVEGEVISSGTVKVGAGSVVIGNITAASAVIAGAVKGDIDVQGPVVVDTSAVIMGNIKSRSVQINNGAVIEGFCSQCYADIDVQGLFDTK